MRLAVSDGNTITASKIIPLSQNFDEAMLSFKKIANEMSGSEKIDALAGGVAGPLNKEKTMLIGSPNISGWINKPIKKHLEEVFGCPVYLENDSALGALGEATRGAGKSYKIVAYIAIGTGVGGARVVDGKIGKNSLGFEPGHQIVIPDGDPCNCTGKGHLETLIGGYYLKEKYGKPAEDIDDPGVWDEVAKYLAMGLNNSIVHWSPDIVILGGSVSNSIPLDKVNKYLKEYCTIFPNPPGVVKVTLNHEAGLYGALELIKSRD